MESELGRFAEEEGPLLLAALICERVLQEKDGALSAIRLIDQITVGVAVGGMPPVPAKDIPEAVVVAPFACAILLVLKGGRLGTQHVVQVIGHPPEGTPREFAPTPFVVGSSVEGTPPGANVVVQLQLVLQKEGVYWFEVRLDDRRITATPLRVAFASSPTQTGDDK